MKTFARKDGSDWVLNGEKRWIGMGTIAAVAVVWAQRTMAYAASWSRPIRPASAPRTSPRSSPCGSRCSATCPWKTSGSRKRDAPEAKGLRDLSPVSARPATDHLGLDGGGEGQLRGGARVRWRARAVRQARAPGSSSRSRSS
jgi:hypothetical protein